MHPCFTCFWAGTPSRSQLLQCTQLTKNSLLTGPALSECFLCSLSYLSPFSKVQREVGTQNRSDMYLLKLNGHFSSPYRLYSATSGFRDQSIQHPLLPQQNERKYHGFHAKLHLNCTPPSNAWRVFAHNSSINGFRQSFSGHLRPEIASIRSGKSGCEPEDSSFHKKGASNLPENHLLNLIEKLKDIQLRLLASEQWNASQLKLSHRVYLASAKKLTHYLALLGLDDEKLKEELSSMGLPNIESVNSSILSHINLSIPLLENMLCEKNSSKKNSVDFDIDSINFMSKSISSHEAALLGTPQEEKKCHIMVTVGREALSNEALVTDLLKAGADVVRINCAHDDPMVWKEIVTMTKNSSQMLEKPCRILMDLAGPKLRTGLVTKEASVMKITPKVNEYGEMISPSLIWICYSASTPLPPHLSMDAIFYVEKELFKDIEVGDTLTLIDARGNKRSIKVRMMEHVSIANCGFIGECSRTAFVKLGTKLYLKKKNRKTSVGKIVKMPTSEPFIMLNTGDLLTMFRRSRLSAEGLATVKFDSAWITCSSDHIFNAVKVGDPIAFDDGKIWGKVQEKNADEITILITRANPLGSRLGSGKSINIPESEVQLKGLTEKDFTDLDFVATHADMVGLSFLRDVDDLITVQHELERRKLSRLGVVLKIETREAFENLPQLLFQAMQFPNPFGVMIARGDLMVECGWSEMANIQEDIMEVCRAANIPVIWATQVLESLIKFGFPTRAEITDLASSIRSSCIMLNKGEHIVEAVSALNSILSNCSMKKTKKMLLKLPHFNSGPTQ